LLRTSIIKVICKGELNLAMKISEIVMFRLPLVECQKLAKTAREEHFETRSHVIREAIAEYLAKKES